jgi:predicted alpha-1,2-mannosidase
VSHTLEYCQADYAIAQLAKALGKDSLSSAFDARSKYYRNYYCKDSGVLRPRTKEGDFLGDFDASVGKHFENVPGFHEGSAYAYTFAATHDVDGLVKLMGGSKQYVNKLQAIFDEGHYDPANEPDIAYPYLFSRFKGEEWRTQKMVKHLLDSCYHNAPNGLPGNDDAGTLSAWALFSMMGLYPDTPGDPSFTLTTPQFKRIIIHTPNGDLTITTDKEASEAPFVKSVSLGEKTLNGMRISHQELLKKGILKFKLSETH